MRLEQKKVPELRDICRSRGLKVSGNKSVLVNRIRNDFLSVKKRKKQWWSNSFVFVGDPNAENAPILASMGLVEPHWVVGEESGPLDINMCGYDFQLFGNPVEVDDKAAVKLRHSDHFMEVAP